MMKGGLENRRAGRAEGPRSPRGVEGSAGLVGRAGAVSQALVTHQWSMTAGLAIKSRVLCSQSSVALGSLAIQMMEFILRNVFLFLNSLCESCLCFLSASFNANPNLTCMCVLWLLLLIWCYLLGIPSLTTVWETKNRHKVRNPERVPVDFPYCCFHF